MATNLTPLEPPDSLHLQAAQGWIELGNPSEAALELRKIAPPVQNHPEVLHVRWHVHRFAKDWAACLEIGRAMLEGQPEHPAGWINYANALFYQRRLEEAFDALLPAAQRFPQFPHIPYNLACYKCQIGDQQAACEWLTSALKLGGTEVKQMALRDEDLQPLWEKIAEM